MDTSFRIIPREDFFARYGLTDRVWPVGASFDRAQGKGQYREHLFSVVGEANPKIYFSTKEGIGFINLGTNVVILPSFTKLSFFDPISGLAYAEIGENQDVIKGYINEQGQWVIQQSKGGVW